MFLKRTIFILTLIFASVLNTGRAEALVFISEILADPKTGVVVPLSRRNRRFHSVGR